MDKKRYSEWVENSFDGLRFVDMLLIGNAQGLGLLDIELIEEFPKIKMDSQLEQDRLNKLRHITLSELWVMGAYELIRIMDEMIPKNKDMLSDETKRKLRDSLSVFTEIRIPLVKFKERGNHKLYSGITQFKWDSVKGIGWEIIFSRNYKIVTKIIYRKELGDIFLDLLKSAGNDIRAKCSPTRD